MIHSDTLPVSGRLFEAGMSEVSYADIEEDCGSVIAAIIRHLAEKHQAKYLFRIELSVNVYDPCLSACIPLPQSATVLKQIHFDLLAFELIVGYQIRLEGQSWICPRKMNIEYCNPKFFDQLDLYIKRYKSLSANVRVIDNTPFPFRLSDS